MNKGLTLVELLAVMVIIGVLALIVLPSVGKTKDEARESAFKASVATYIRGLEATILSKKLNTGFNSRVCTIQSNIVTCANDEIEYKPKGDKPTSGYLFIDDGNIIEYSLCMKDHKVSKSGKATTIVKDDKCTVSEITHKGVVYLDPTDLSRTCTAQDAAANVNSTTHTPTGVTSGCMKFYIYDDTGDNYKMILDHNTSGDVSGSAANTRLHSDTDGWIGTPRLITADEVAHIVGADRSDTIKWYAGKTYVSSNSINTSTNASWFYLDGGRNVNKTSYSAIDGWQKSYANTLNKSDYAWLYDYTQGCTVSGCNVADSNQYPYSNTSNTSLIYGYWTNTTVNGASSKQWNVYGTGRLSADYSTSTNLCGVRPVITLPKTLID